MGAGVTEQSPLAVLEVKTELGEQSSPPGQPVATSDSAAQVASLAQFDEFAEKDLQLADRVHQAAKQARTARCCTATSCHMVSVVWL